MQSQQIQNFAQSLDVMFNSKLLPLEREHVMLIYTECGHTPFYTFIHRSRSTLMSYTVHKIDIQYFNCLVLFGTMHQTWNSYEVNKRLLWLSLIAGPATDYFKNCKFWLDDTEYTAIGKILLIVWKISSKDCSKFHSPWVSNLLHVVSPVSLGI